MEGFHLKGDEASLAFLHAVSDVVEERREEADGAALYVHRRSDVAEGGPIYLNLHPGGLINMGGEVCRRIGELSAETMGVEVWSVDYRMPPEHPFPAGLDDCGTVARRPWRSPACIATTGAVLADVLADIRVPCPGAGRPRTRLDAAISEKSDIIAARKRRVSRGGRPPSSTSRHSAATSSNATSHCSNNGEHWPSATTSSPSSTEPASSSPPASPGHGSGLALQGEHPHGLKP